MINERGLLQRLMEGPVSGDELARACGQTRAAAWKRIEDLRQAGVPIRARPGRGYELEHEVDLLDGDAIVASLALDIRPRLASLEVAWSLDSTNSALLRERSSNVAGDAPGDCHKVRILLAERQTGGRGRRGREWASPLAAHVYLSASREFAGGLSRLGGLSLVAGIASVEALHSLGFTSVRLKWPNDLVIATGSGLKKLGGLLVEGAGEHAGPARAVIGLGLNVRMPEAAAAAIDQPWCDLAALAGDECCPLPSRNDLVALLLDHWLPALDAFDVSGLGPFLPRYAALDALSGHAVTVRSESNACSGEALGLASDGALQVRLEDGEVRAFHAGEVSVRAGSGNV